MGINTSNKYLCYRLLKLWSGRLKQQDSKPGSLVTGTENRTIPSRMDARKRNSSSRWPDHHSQSRITSFCFNLRNVSFYIELLITSFYHILTLILRSRLVQKNKEQLNFYIGANLSSLDRCRDRNQSITLASLEKKIRDNVREMRKSIEDETGTQISPVSIFENLPMLKIHRWLRNIMHLQGTAYTQLQDKG